MLLKFNEMPYKIEQNKGIGLCSNVRCCSSQTGMLQDTGCLHGLVRCSHYLCEYHSCRHTRTVDDFDNSNTLNAVILGEVFFSYADKPSKV